MKRRSTVPVNARSRCQAGRKKLSGAARMKQQGYKRVELWLDMNEFAIITNAAKLRDKPLASFIRELAMFAAGDYLQYLQKGGRK